jgi:hypothetical protein
MLAGRRALEQKQHATISRRMNRAGMLHGMRIGKAQEDRAAEAHGHGMRIGKAQEDRAAETHEQDIHARRKERAQREGLPELFFNLYATGDAQSAFDHYNATGKRKLAEPPVQTEDGGWKLVHADGSEMVVPPSRAQGAAIYFDPKAEAFFGGKGKQQAAAGKTLPLKDTSLWAGDVLGQLGFETDGLLEAKQDQTGNRYDAPSTLLQRAVQMAEREVEAAGGERTAAHFEAALGHAAEKLGLPRAGEWAREPLGKLKYDVEAMQPAELAQVGADALRLMKAAGGKDTPKNRRKYAEQAAKALNVPKRGRGGRASQSERGQVANVAAIQDMKLREAAQAWNAASAKERESEQGQRFKAVLQREGLL